MTASIRQSQARHKCVLGVVTREGLMGRLLTGIEMGSRDSPRLVKCPETSS